MIIKIYTADTLTYVNLDDAYSLYQALRKLPKDILLEIPHGEAYKSYLDEVEEFIRDEERLIDDPEVHYTGDVIFIPRILFKYIRFFREVADLTHEII